MPKQFSYLESDQIPNLLNKINELKNNKENFIKLLRSLHVSHFALEETPKTKNELKQFAELSNLLDDLLKWANNTAGNITNPTQNQVDDFNNLISASADLIDSITEAAKASQLHSTTGALNLGNVSAGVNSNNVVYSVSETYSDRILRDITALQNQNERFKKSFSCTANKVGMYAAAAAVGAGFIAAIATFAVGIAAIIGSGLGIHLTPHIDTFLTAGAGFTAAAYFTGVGLYYKTFPKMNAAKLHDKTKTLESKTRAFFEKPTFASLPRKQNVNQDQIEDRIAIPKRAIG